MQYSSYAVQVGSWRGKLLIPCCGTEAISPLHILKNFSMGTKQPMQYGGYAVQVGS